MKIEVQDLLDGKQVKSAESLGEFVTRASKAINELSDDVTNKEAVEKLAADLKEAKTTLSEIEKEAKKAVEMAKAAARTAPDPLTLSESQLKALPLHYDVEKDPDFRNKLKRGHYNVLMMSKGEMEMLPEPVRKSAERLRYLNDAIAIAHHLLLARGGAPAQDYIARGGMKSLRMWDEWERTSKVFAGAMDTAETGAGAEWVPTGVGISLIEDVRPNLEFVSYIPTIPMPRSPYLYPVQGNHFKAYLVPENTADPISPGGGTAIGRRDLSTLNLTFTAKKLAAMSIFSTEFDEDSIVPVIPAVRTDLAFAVAASLEDAWINGQQSGTIDTGSDPATDDPRDAWDGWRKAADLVGVEYDFGAGLVVEGLTEMKGGLGKYGKNPSQGVFLTSYIGWAKCLTLKDSSGSAVVLTQDKLGGAATFPNGTLGMMLGSPLVVGDDFPQNLNSSGIIDGAGTKTAILYGNRMQFRHGEVRLAMIEGSRERFFEFDQVALKVTYRGEGKAVRTPSSSFKVVALGKNL